MTAPATSPQATASAHATMRRTRYLVLSIVTAAATVRAHLDCWPRQSDTRDVHDDATTAERVAGSLTRRANNLRRAMTTEDRRTPAMTRALDEEILRLHHGESRDARAVARILERFHSLKNADALPF